LLDGEERHVTTMVDTDADVDARAPEPGVP
jgi:hypothetical protein